MSDQDPLVFMMGEYKAEFPQDRLYVKNHMWAMPIESSKIRFGFSAYAVRLLQDVYFLDWAIDAGATVSERQNIGSIESKKAESDLFAPMSGRLTKLNDEVLDDPSAINVQPYGDGWLFEITAEANDLLLEPPAYIKHLRSAWNLAQKTIKGQAGE